MMGSLRALVVGCLLGSSSVAWATSGLAWKWEPGEERRYFMEAELLLPDLVVLSQAKNTSVRASELTLTLITTCALHPPVGKKAFDLLCSIDDVRLVAAPVRSDAGRLIPVLDELDASLLKSQVQVTMTWDGRVRTVSLEGLEDRLRRMRVMEETLRLVVQRAFAGLDLRMPKKGDDEDSPWEDSSSLSLGFVTMFGSYGKGLVYHGVVDTEGDVVRIESQGGGIMMPGTDQTIVTPDGSSVSRARDSFEMVHRGEARFDVAKGLVLERIYQVSGVPTSSSQIAEGAAGVSYVQNIRVRYMADGVDAPKLPGNGELAPGGSRGM